jgi:hypothetical protein
MKINKRFILSFVAPFMILISAVGLIFRDNTRKVFLFTRRLDGDCNNFGEGYKQKIG